MNKEKHGLFWEKIRIHENQYQSASNNGYPSEYQVSIRKCFMQTNPQSKMTDFGHQPLIVALLCHLLGHIMTPLMIY